MIPATKKPRCTIHDIEKENHPHVFVRNIAHRMTGQPTHVLIEHTSTQSGNRDTYEVPMTRIPYDLAVHVPKEELLRNPTLRKALENDCLELIPSDQAKRELEEPGALEEMDRLRVMRQQRSRSRQHESAAALQAAEQRSAQANAEANARALPPAAKGDVDNSMEGVKPAVVAAMQETNLTNAHRVSLLKNLTDIMSDTDKRWVRSQTEDPAIRALVD